MVVIQHKVTSNRSHDEGNGIPVQVHLMISQVANVSFFHFVFLVSFFIWVRQLVYLLSPSLSLSKSLRRSILSSSLFLWSSLINLLSFNHDALFRVSLRKETEGKKLRGGEGKWTSFSFPIISSPFFSHHFFCIHCFSFILKVSGKISWKNRVFLLCKIVFIFLENV